MLFRSISPKIATVFFAPPDSVVSVKRYLESFSQSNPSPCPPSLSGTGERILKALSSPANFPLQGRLSETYSVSSLILRFKFCSPAPERGGGQGEGFSVHPFACQSKFLRIRPPAERKTFPAAEPVQARTDILNQPDTARRGGAEDVREKRSCATGNLRGGVRRGNPHSRDISGRATAVLDGVSADCVRSVLLSGTLNLERSA